MCYRLRREIEDLFPPETTPEERLVALEIAEYGKLATRISIITPDLLCSRTGMDRRGISGSLTLLKRRGLEFRKALKTGRNGEPVYSFRGVAPQYRVPFPDEFRAAWELAGAMLTALPSLNAKPP